MWIRLILLAVVSVWLFSLPSACNRDSLATGGAGDEAVAPKQDSQVAGESTVAKPREKGPTTVVMLNESNFEKIVLKADRPVVVDFDADWCYYCKQMAPTIKLLAEQYKGEVVFGKLNVDLNKRIQSKYSVGSLPTLIIFSGGKPVQYLVGFNNKNVIETMINKVAAG